MKKIKSRKFYKISLMVLVALGLLFTPFVVSNASGIEYNEDDTIFNFDLNNEYLSFVSDNFPNDFSYYFTLPITFNIGNDSNNYHNLSVRIVNGNVNTISYEGLSNDGMPIDNYFVLNGIWTYEDVMTEVAFNEGINIREVYVNDLYSYNFQGNDNRDYENYINRFFQYLAVNNLLTIKLNTYRFKTNVGQEVIANDDILFNISQVYVAQTEDSYNIVGLTIGGTLLDPNGDIMNIPIPKISFFTNNEKYNELEIGVDIDNNEVITAQVSYNNFRPYDFENDTSWVNNNYKFLTLYNNIGIMDYLNLSIYGDFNVSQFWVDPDVDSTFNDLFTGIANVPIVVLSNLLSFSIFGWQAFAVLCGIITLLVIIWLIRKLTK